LCHYSLATRLANFGIGHAKLGLVKQQKARAAARVFDMAIGLHDWDE
jgi:hypothetical protein